MRPAESTNIHRRERTSKFVDEYGHLPIRAIDDEHVAAWIKGGRDLGTVQHLRTFFNDAATVPAGRLVAVHQGTRPGELDALAKAPAGPGRAGDAHDDRKLRDVELAARYR